MVGIEERRATANTPPPSACAERERESERAHGRPNAPNQLTPRSTTGLPSSRIWLPLTESLTAAAGVALVLYPVLCAGEREVLGRNARAARFSPSLAVNTSCWHCSSSKRPAVGTAAAASARTVAPRAVDDQRERLRAYDTTSRRVCISCANQKSLRQLSTRKQHALSCICAG